MSTLLDSGNLTPVSGQHLSTVIKSLTDISDCVNGAKGYEDASLKVQVKSKISRIKLAQLLQRDTINVCGGALHADSIASLLGVKNVNIISYKSFLDNHHQCNLIVLPHHSFFQDNHAADVLLNASRRLDFISAIQFRDHHHRYRDNLNLASIVDFVFPGHPYKHHYLRTVNLNVLSVIHMCSGQWNPRLLKERFYASDISSRSNKLYGGYGYYPRYQQRTSFIDQISQQLEGCAVAQWRDPNAAGYMQLSNEERLIDWLNHKVSVIVNTDLCIPNRIFDALVTGQIPLVPYGLINLETIIPFDMQKKLPILRYSDFDIGSLVNAYRKALAIFDAGGMNSCKLRHEYVINNHLYEHRAAKMLECLREVADQVTMCP